MRRSSARWAVRIAAALAGLLLAAAVGVHFWAVAWIAHAIADAPNAGKVIAAADDQNPGEIARLGVDRQLRVEVGPPPASLSVWVLDPRGTGGRTHGTVLVLHGIRDRKTTMLGMGRLLAESGYRAVLVDLRGHGRSSGQWLTYGIIEARDLKQLADALERRGLIEGGLGVYGPSYGGAMALEYAARDPRVRAVVSVSTFSSAREAIFDYVRRTAPRWLVREATIGQALRKAGRMSGVSLEDARTVDAIRRTRASCLLLHGTADALLPPRHAHALAAAASPQSQLLLLEGENHDTIFADRSGELRRQSVGWFDRWLGGPQKYPLSQMR
jgi:uncharacterized protein